MNDQRNFFIIFFLVFAAFWGYEYFFPHPAPIEHAQTEVAAPAVSVAPVLDEKAIAVPKDVALREGNRVAIDTPSFSGSINLKGARFDDIVLKKYKETVEPRSSNVDLLNPENTEKPFYVEFTWVSVSNDQKSFVTFPSEKTEWTADRETLTSEHPLKLTWKSPEGVVFERHISVDQDQM
ncbi:MAG: membrane protein insertase YidC, partial [Alphaproteobacteria bacterium]|nr:membrane protein insertase YidC [Alphaproteobacteria bacterium]